MKVTVIGCGVMGSAFARQFASKGHLLRLCDRNVEKGTHLAIELSAEFIKNPADAAKDADVVLLGIKPKDFEELAGNLGKTGDQIILSMLMGVSLETLKEHFPKSLPIRCMPNLALKYGQSVIALVKDSSLKGGAVSKVETLLDGLGLVFWTDEDKIDPITALTGSGPAFVIGMIEAMVESGIAMGLRSSEAKELSLATIRSALALIENYEGHPGAIRWDISAPAGSTIAGMHAFEEEAVRAGIMNTFLAAYKRVKGEK